MKEKTDLRFGDNLDSHILPLQAPFSPLGRASITEMAAPHLFAKLIMSYKLLQEPEILIQRNLTFISFRDWGLIRLNGTVPSGEQCSNVLCWRRRRKWALENAQRGRTHTRVGGRVLEKTGQGTWAVEGEVWGLAGLGTRQRVIVAGNYRVLGFGFWVFNGFSMTESHGIGNQ